MRRNKRTEQEDAELDITSFMNLMIVLVPVLLLSMVFSQTTVLDLNMPGQSDETNRDPRTMQLEVIVNSDKLVLSESLSKGVIETFPMIPVKEIVEGGPTMQHDFASLSKWLQALKQEAIDNAISDGLKAGKTVEEAKKDAKSDIQLLLQKDTPYSLLVTLMDTVRSYHTVIVGSVVEAELFPKISIGDAPVE